MNKIKKLKNAKKGFTLIEMIVVLVIIAILAAIAIPALTGYIKNAKDKQVLTEARTVYVAAQAVASENYSKNDTNAADITAASINDLAGQTLVADNAGAFTVAIDTNGHITSFTYTRNSQTAKLDTNGNLTMDTTK